MKLPIVQGSVLQSFLSWKCLSEYAYCLGHWKPRIWLRIHKNKQQLNLSFWHTGNRGPCWLILVLSNDEDFFLWMPLNTNSSIFHLSILVSIKVLCWWHKCLVGDKVTRDCILKPIIMDIPFLSHAGARCIYKVFWMYNFWAIFSHVHTDRVIFRVPESIHAKSGG